MLGRLGDRPAAKQELRALLESEPDNSGILGRLAAMELEDGDYARRGRAVDQAGSFRARPGRAGRPVSCGSAGFTCAGSTTLRVALGAYERVLRISPGNREALEALSDLYARQNDTRKAIAVTERLVDRGDRSGKAPALPRPAGHPLGGGRRQSGGRE